VGYRRLSLQACRGFNRIAVPTGANPDFLLRTAGNNHDAVFFKKNRTVSINTTTTTTLDRKSGGSVVEVPAVPLPV
jgi:hypothetical protein